MTKSHKKTSDQQVSARIASNLREKILLGDLSPDTRLRQREIANEFGVSLMPARDAIKRLVRDGLAIHPAPKTFTVAPVSASDFIEIMELRLLLEPMALERSAPKLKPENFSRLRDILAIQSAECTAIETASNHWNFHKLLYSQMGRPRTLEIIEQLNLHLNRYLVPVWSTIGIQDDWVSHHSALVTFIESGNFSGAVKELRSDLDKTMIRVVKEISI